MIEHNNKKPSIRKQCELLTVNRSRVYYSKKEVCMEDVVMMNEIRDIYEKCPFYGYRRMHAVLIQKGYTINRKKVQRLMQLAGIKAIYPKKKTTKRNQEHRVYPYLLKDLKINRPNQAWQVDITYIKVKRGFVYLVALLDIFSRKIVGWNMSIFLDTVSCLDALDKALQIGQPDILNSDQGCQFTSEVWISKLNEEKIEISMDGKGRWADNVYIERFWRSLKYESVFLQSFDSVTQAREAIGRYIGFYNRERPHQALGYKTPDAVYYNYKNTNESEEKIQNFLFSTSSKREFTNSQIQANFWS